MVICMLNGSKWTKKSLTRFQVVKDFLFTSFCINKVLNNVLAPTGGLLSDNRAIHCI